MERDQHRGGRFGCAIEAAWNILRKGGRETSQAAENARTHETLAKTRANYYTISAKGDSKVDDRFDSR